MGGLNVKRGRVEEQGQLFEAQDEADVEMSLKRPLGLLTFDEEPASSTGVHLRIRRETSWWERVRALATGR